MQASRRGESPRRPPREERAAGGSSDMEEDDGEDEDDIKLEAKTDAGKHITSMLNSLLLKDAKSTQVARARLAAATIRARKSFRIWRSSSPQAAIAWCSVTDAGLTFTVSEAKTLQVRAGSLVGSADDSVFYSSPPLSLLIDACDRVRPAGHGIH